MNTTQPAPFESAVSATGLHKACVPVVQKLMHSQQVRQGWGRKAITKGQTQAS